MKRTYRIWSRHRVIDPDDATREFEGKTLEECDESARMWFTEKFIKEKGDDSSDLILYRIDAPAVAERTTMLRLGNDLPVPICFEQSGSGSAAA